MDILRSLMILCAVPLAVAQSVTPALERHVEAAQKAQAQQDCHTASAEYAAAVHLMPSSGELRNNQGIALYCDGQLPAAIAAFKKALGLNSSLATPHLFLGLASHRLGDEATAGTELQHFLKFNSTDQTAHLWLGYTYVAEHRHDLAIEQFESVAQLDPANADAQYSLGQAHLELGRQKARELETLAPNGALILKLAGEQFRDAGNTARAATAFQESEDRLKLRGTVDPVVLEKEQALYEQAHNAALRARQAFQAVAQYAPESFRAHQIMAESLVAMERQEAAIDEYRRVLELNPTLPGIHEAISNCFMHGAHFADALKELREEQQLQVDSGRLLTEVGQVQLEMGEDRGAASSLRKALTFPDPPNEAYLLLGNALLRERDAKAAISALQMFLSKSTDSPSAYYLLARAYRLAGDPEAMNRTLAIYRNVAQNAKSRPLIQSVTDAPNSTAVLHSAEPEDAEKLGAPQL